jgi:hypothetical protein
MALLSDRSKRRLILWPTAGLPKPLRIAVRDQLLRRLEIGKARRAVGIVIGHPKSGNTWLRTMISRLYQVRYDLPASLVIKTDDLHRRNREIPSFFCTNGWYGYEDVIQPFLAPGAPDHWLRHKAFVLLARNPCDVSVSWYFQFARRVSPSKRELINATLARPIDHETISMWDFVMQSEVGLPSLIDFLNSWERSLASLPHTLLVRYEDLRSEPAATLARILSHFSLSFSDDEIAEAVRFGSFDNMKRLESEGFFQRSGLAVVDRSDPDASKVRRGKVGGYREYFTPEQVAEMERLVAEKLSPRFGYGYRA